MISSNPTPTTPAHMETSGWLRNSFGGGNDGGGGGGGGGDSGGHIGNLTNNNAWDNSSWDISTSTPVAAAANYRYDWTNLPRVPEASAIHALLFGHVTDNAAAAAFRRGVTDPHMMCLKLGKRHYCDDAVVPDRHVLAAESSSAAKTKRHVTTMTTATHDAVATATTVAGRWPAAVRVATRCQVEGCNVALGNVKEYYRRHKVCEIHSKAPEVVVSGLQQRFCQQCSRFHDVTEFDEAKRSCRRRLEGHNLRRRKENNPVMKRRLGPSSQSPLKPVRAFSLLSSPEPEPLSSSGDLSSRCSAALYELIAANRSTSLHFVNQNSSHQPISDDAMHTAHDTKTWEQFSHTAMTLDHKQAPALDFGLLPMKEESKDPEGWTDYCWSGFGGSNVV